MFDSLTDWARSEMTYFPLFVVHIELSQPGFLLVINIALIIAFKATYLGLICLFKVFSQYFNSVNELDLLLRRIIFPDDLFIVVSLAALSWGIFAIISDQRGGRTLSRQLPHPDWITSSTSLSHHRQRLTISVAWRLRWWLDLTRETILLGHYVRDKGGHWPTWPESITLILSCALLLAVGAKEFVQFALT